MDVLEAAAAVEGDGRFAAYREEHPDAYLAHLFAMHAPNEEASLQLGYTTPGSGRLTVFTHAPVERLPEDEAFSEEGAIAPLDLGQVRIGFAEAEERALACQRAEYPREEPTKLITILQRLDRQLYNITLVTAQFNILNIRIDAASGEVASHEQRSILSLRE